MICVETLERNITRPICFVPFAIANECYTLCDIANDGWLKFDRLCVDHRQHQRVTERKKDKTCLASAIAASHCCKRARTRARLAST